VRGIVFGSLAALTLGIVSTNALAASAEAVRGITVSYSELDLSKSVGAKVLYKRIQLAAFEVCNEFVGPFSELRTKASGCYRNAVANAVAQVNSAQLTAQHRAHVTRLAS